MNFFGKLGLCQPQIKDQFRLSLNTNDQLMELVKNADQQIAKLDTITSEGKLWKNFDPIFKFEPFNINHTSASSQILANYIVSSVSEVKLKVVLAMEQKDQNQKHLSLKDSMENKVVLKMFTLNQNCIENWSHTFECVVPVSGTKDYNCELVIPFSKPFILFCKTINVPQDLNVDFYSCASLISYR